MPTSDHLSIDNFFVLTSCFPLIKQCSPQLNLWVPSQRGNVEWLWCGPAPCLWISGSCDAIVLMWTIYMWATDEHNLSKIVGWFSSCCKLYNPYKFDLGLYLSEEWTLDDLLKILNSPNLKSEPIIILEFGSGPLVSMKREFRCDPSNLNRWADNRLILRSYNA